MKTDNVEVVYSQDYKTITLKITCPQCKNIFELTDISTLAYDNWINGELIQRAFPKLSASDREKIKTGICDKCWDKIFGE